MVEKQNYQTKGKYSIFKIIYAIEIIKLLIQYFDIKGLCFH